MDDRGRMRHCVVAQQLRVLIPRPATLAGRQSVPE
jgi:hypothetical protein